MTKDRAIAKLSESANVGMTTFNAEYKAAQKLGIQALIRCKELKEVLNGETKLG